METSARAKIVLAVAGVVGGMTGAASGQSVLLGENFDSLPLGPFVSGTEGGGDGTDWTATPPAGWTQDLTTTPVGSPEEFRGFTFMDPLSWVATEGNQDRVGFTKGSGAIMVADPDAYDDGTGIEPDLFNAFITTPQISLANVTPNTVVLDFDSSFRPYDGMTASVEVRFDGGSFSNILEYTTANSGGDSSLLRVDEDVTINVANAAGNNSVQFRFGLTDAGNDWWWAVDNVQVTGELVPEPASAALLGLGLAALTGRRRH